jgi:cobalamin biosynthesis protein CbiG
MGVWMWIHCMMLLMMARHIGCDQFVTDITQAIIKSKTTATTATEEKNLVSVCQAFIRLGIAWT